MFKLKRMRWARHVVYVEEIRNAYRVLVENIEGKRPFGRFRGSQNNISKMNIKKLRCEGMVWIQLAQAWNQ
jgi:hypothetical protein